MLYIEGNFGGWAMTQRIFCSVKANCRSVFAVHSLKGETKNHENDVGIFTTQQDKYLGVELFNCFLLSNKIRFLDTFFTTQPLPEGKSRKEDLYIQLCNLEYRVKETAEWTTRKFRITGKARGPDDCGMGLVLGVLHASFLMIDKYAVRSRFPHIEPLDSTQIAEMLYDESRSRAVCIKQ